METCRSCGARNAASAWWCTQCYTPLDESRVADRPERDPAPPAGGRQAAAGDTDAAADPGDTGGDPARHDADTDGRDIRERDGEVEWRCGLCGSWQPLGRSHCATCGTERTGFGYHPRPQRRSAPSVTALAAGVVLPGLGHLLLGAVGAGIARLVLWVVWLGGGIWLLLEPASRNVGGVLVAGAVALWGASLVGVARLASGEPDPVGTRLLALGVGAVMLVTVVLALAAILAAL